VSELLSSEFHQSPQLVVIRLIRAIRGLNILSFQLQNHSTSLMPTRRVGPRVTRALYLSACPAVPIFLAYSFDSWLTNMATKTGTLIHSDLH